MRACYFGPSSRRLFGVLEAPAAETSDGAGVVLCHPHGPDYATAFRAVRVLGGRCAVAGMHVLRFDYTATGDSSGDIDEASVPQWVSDIGTAIQMLRDSCTLRDVSVVGLRLGATLAAHAAAELQQVDRLVLWEPVVDGRQYLVEQSKLQQAWVEDEMREGRLAPSAEDELLGYPLTGRLRRDIEGLSLDSLTQLPAPSVCLLSHRQSGEYERLAAHWRGLGARVDLRIVEGPTVWSKTPSMEDSSIPNASIASIVAWLAGTA